jgi:copper chaperone CopZ
MLKKLLILLLLMTGQQYLFAQVSTAKLQATGLTCALCSNAINKALQELPFVESVESIIKESAFAIQYKKGQSIKPDLISGAVEDAGFFVGELLLTAELDNLTINENGRFILAGNSYHLLESNLNKLDGKITFRLLDKSFLTEKAFKKVARLVDDSCSQTGNRIYHVALIK